MFDVELMSRYNVIPFFPATQVVVLRRMVQYQRTAEDSFQWRSRREVSARYLLQYFLDLSGLLGSLIFLQSKIKRRR